MSRLSPHLDGALRWAASLLMLALLACVVIGVVARALNAPVAWSDEAAQYLLVWTGFIGWMIAARRRSHIRITMLLDLLPPLLKRLAETVIQLAVIGLAVALIHYGFPLIGRNWDIEWVSLPLSAGLLYLPVPFAAAVLIGQALVAIAEVWAGAQPASPEPGAQPL